MLAVHSISDQKKPMLSGYQKTAPCGMIMKPPQDGPFLKKLLFFLHVRCCKNVLYIINNTIFLIKVIQKYP